MSHPRKGRSSRIGPQRTNKYFHILDTPLRLVHQTNPAAQENDSYNKTANVLAGRRSGDKDHSTLYELWLSLSEREQHVTYLTCQGYKNHQIAFAMGVSARTVKSYLEQVFRKTYVHSKMELRLKFFNFDFAAFTPTDTSAPDM